MNDAKRALHRFRLKTRRKIRKQKRQVEDITIQADDSLDRLVFRRFNRLYTVRRFVAGWVLLILLIGFGAVWQVRGLDTYYLTSQPTNGGVYREGLIGTFTTANPLFAVSGADAAVARLTFDGLFRLTANSTLEPLLATTIEADDKGLVYTVGLRSDVLWHDGEAFTSEDVVFTYKSIQDVATRSPLRSSWLGVKVAAVDEHTVTFTLPNTLSSFKYSLINGIVPEHILSKLSPEDLRSSLFNTVSPVGTGPFVYENVEVLGSSVEERQEKVTLTKNNQYYAKTALINGVVIRTYREAEVLLRDFRKKEINAMVGLNTLPEDLQNQDEFQSFSTPISSTVMLFFNTSTELLKDKNLRQALTYATDSDHLRKSISYPLLKADSPFLSSHFAYNPDIVQLDHNQEKAVELLDKAGWKVQENGKRSKDGQELRFRLVSQSLAEYSTVVQQLQSKWGELGITVDAVLQPEQDIQSGAIAQHDYDMLLYGISLGPDPDVFAFWHSSQADPRQPTRLNLSEYRSKVADEALEGGRTRLDEELRRVKYEPFLRSWRSDAPAIALYQPRFLLVTQGTFKGYTSGQFSNAVDRFYSITDWQIRSEKTLK